MKELYIHIGMGKTGTTALQEFFYENRDVLRKNGICYPDLGIVSGAHHLLSPHHPKFLPDWDYIPVEKWVDELSKVEEERILISSELISSLSCDRVQEFLKSLTASFFVHIVVYIRNPHDFVKSAFAQQVKVGMQKKGFDHAFETIISKHNAVKLINCWGFDNQNCRVIALPYEKNSFFNDNLIDDFLYKVLGVKLDSCFTLSHDKNINPSMWVEFIPIKIYLNNIVSDVYHAKKINKIIEAYCSEFKRTFTEISQVDFYSNQQIKVINEMTNRINDVFFNVFGNCDSHFELCSSKEHVDLSIDSDLCEEFFRYMKRFYGKEFSLLVETKNGISKFEGDKYVNIIFDRVANDAHSSKLSFFLSMLNRLFRSN